MLKKVPHTYVIIFYIIVFAAIITWVIPGGKYIDIDTVVDGQQVLTKQFQYTDSSPQTWQIFSALFKGFERQAGIIIFILMIGGAFWIMNSSKAIDVGILSFLKATKKLERYKIIKLLGIDNIIMTLIMLMFSVFGAVFGMSEETIAFIVIVVPLAVSMGYDSIVGVSLAFVAAGLGFAGAVLNPFTIGIAQGLSGLQLFSGIEFRMFSWVVINFIGIFYVLRYARKIKRNPEKSVVYKEDEYWRERENVKDSDLDYYTNLSSKIIYFLILGVLTLYSVMPSISEVVKHGELIIPQTVNLGFLHLVETQLKIGTSTINILILPIITVVFAIIAWLSLRKSVHYFNLVLLFLTMVILVIGVMGYDWYIMEIAAIFFAMGLLSGIASGYSPDKITKLFIAGVGDIMSAAIVVGLAGGIIVILEDGQVIDTILHSLSQSMEGMSKVASVGIMYMIQTVINIVIPSGSAKAALTMPIMAPFSDLIGVSRQATVMAFQFGDGFTNMITPTSGVLIAVLGVAKIPYEKWVRWVWPLILILTVIGFVLLIPTVTMELNGF